MPSWKLLILKFGVKIIVVYEAYSAIITAIMEQPIEERASKIDASSNLSRLVN